MREYRKQSKAEILRYRYWIFAYDDHYPAGGLSDLEAGAGSEAAAVEFALALVEDHVQVFDTQKRKVIWDKDQQDKAL